MQTMLPVLPKNSGSGQFGELARGKPALAVHLKETFLGMKVTQGPSEVSTGPSSQCRHPMRIARHSDRSGDLRCRDGALQQRKARAQLDNRPEAHEEHQNGEYPNGR
jgi:hypothetical protein